MGRNSCKRQSETHFTTGVILNYRDISDTQDVLNGDTAEEVWNICNAKLQDKSYERKKSLSNSLMLL